MDSAERFKIELLGKKEYEKRKKQERQARAKKILKTLKKTVDKQ